MNSQNAPKRFVPGSSRGARNAHTLALQMALEAERQAEIGARIKELREGLHLPQPIVAERVGVSLRAYQKWEQGKGVAWPNFERLVEVLQTSEDFLLNGPAEDQPGADTQLDRLERLMEENAGKLDLLIGLLTGDMPSEVVTEGFVALADTRGQDESVEPGSAPASGGRRAAPRARSARTRAI